MKDKKGMIFKSFICSSILSIVSLFLLFLIHSNFSQLFFMNRYHLNFEYISQSVYMPEDRISGDRYPSQDSHISLGTHFSETAHASQDNLLNSGNPGLNTRVSTKFNSRIMKKLNQLYDNSIILNRIRSVRTEVVNGVVDKVSKVSSIGEKKSNVAECSNVFSNDSEFSSVAESTHVEGINVNDSRGMESSKLNNSADCRASDYKTAESKIMSEKKSGKQMNLVQKGSEKKNAPQNLNKSDEKNSRHYNEKPSDKISDRDNNSRLNKRYFTSSFIKVEYDMIGFHCYLQEYIDDVSYKVVDRGYLIENIWFSVKYLYLFFWLLFLILFAGMVAKGVIFLNFHSVYVLRLIGAGMNYTIKHLRKSFFGFFFNFCVLLLLLSFIMVLFFNYSANFTDLANLMGFLNYSSYYCASLQMTLCFFISALVFYSVFFSHIFVTLKRL